MPILQLGTLFPLTGVVTEISPNDTMFDTSEHYLRAGLSALDIIEHAISRNFIRPSGLETILDIPCGHGRIARILRSRFPDADLTVCDIDRDGVDFCADKFGATRVYGTNNFDTMELGNFFDFIWVGSLITHFDANQTASFIRCMTRHLSQDGLLILTSHGKTVIRNAAMSAAHFGLCYTRAQGGRVSASAIVANARLRYRVISSINRQYRTVGYGFSDDPHIGEYGFSIISRQWLEGFFAGQPFSIIEYKEQAWDSRQDVLFIRRKVK